MHYSWEKAAAKKGMLTLWTDYIKQKQAVQG